MAVAMAQGTENVVVLFFTGMLLTCAVEYITAVLLEKLFDVKWWDYSDRRFNLNGRVCLLGAVVFGVLSVLLIKVFHPHISALTAQAPEWLQIVLAGILFCLILWDLYATVRHLLRLNSRLKDIQAAINEFFSKNIKRCKQSSKVHTFSPANAHFFSASFLAGNGLVVS